MIDEKIKNAAVIVCRAEPDWMWSQHVVDDYNAISFEQD